MIQRCILVTYFNFTLKQKLMTLYSEKKVQPTNFIFVGMNS